MKAAIVLSILLNVVLIFTVQADVIEVEYKRLNSHTKKLDSEDTQSMQFAFGFVNVRQPGTLCAIRTANIITPKKTLSLEVSPEGRFTVPTEKALKLADAMVQVDLVEAANVCDMSVQLETKAYLLNTEYATKDLQHIYQQYTSFFNAMGSFMSFLMPQVDGLMFQFKDPQLDYVIQPGLQIEQGILRLSQQQLHAINTLRLPRAPLRITALTSR